MQKDFSVRYTNWRKETSVRNIRFQKLWYGCTDFHPQAQWLIDGYCLDRQADRTFALRDMAPANHEPLAIDVRQRDVLQVMVANTPIRVVPEMLFLDGGEWILEFWNLRVGERQQLPISELSGHDPANGPANSDPEQQWAQSRIVEAIRTSGLASADIDRLARSVENLTPDMMDVWAQKVGIRLQIG